MRRRMCVRGCSSASGQWQRARHVYADVVKRVSARTQVGVPAEGTVTIDPCAQLHQRIDECILRTQVPWACNEAMLIIETNWPR